MDFIGKWKLKGINVPTENGVQFFTRETAPEEMGEVFDEGEQMLLEFCEDGTYNMIVEAVGEIAEAAAAEGYPIREDGYAVVSSAKWEDRDGKIFYDSQAEGTIGDEEIDPFVELTFTPEGYILYNFLYVYEKI